MTRGQRRKGFTLVETLVAVSILAGALVVLTIAWRGSKLSLLRAQKLTTIYYLLQKKVTEFELKYDGKPLEEVKEEEDGDFGSDYPNLRWAVKTKELAVPDLSSALIAGGEGNEGMLMIMKGMTEYLSKAIKEMKVSIFLKSGEKEKEFSVTTYLVDYEKDIAGVGGGK